MMSQKQYRTTLIILIGSFIFSIPGSFSSTSVFKEFFESNKEFLAALSLIVSLGFYWPVLLRYFRQKKFNAVFYLGVLFAVATNLVIGSTFFAKSESQSSRLAMLIIVLLYMLSGLLFFLSIAVSRKTKHLKLLRYNGVMGFIRLAFYVTLVFLNRMDLLYIGALVWIVESIILVLHFVYERNLTPELKASEEILDMD